MAVDAAEEVCGARPFDDVFGDQDDDGAGFYGVAIGINGGRGFWVAEVIWVWLGGVNDAVPAFLYGEGHQLEGEWLPIRIEQDAEMFVAFSVIERKGQTAGICAPVWLIEMDAMPCDAGAGAFSIRPPKMAITKEFMPLCKGDCLLNEAEKLFVFVYILPVEPAYFIVLAVGVVVPLLGTHDFIPHTEHGGALCYEQDGEEIFNLPEAEGADLGIVCFAF